MQYFEYRNYVYRQGDDGKFYIYMANANEHVVSSSEDEIKQLVNLDIEMGGVGYVKNEK